MSTIPNMTHKEEQFFWQNNDATDYLEDMEPVKLITGSSPKNQCPICHETLLTRLINVELAHGKVELRKVHQRYCKNGHQAHLVEESQRLVDAIESVLNLVQPVYSQF